MPFYKIDRHMVFLSHDRWSKINGLALGHKDPSFRIDSMIAGRPQVREADKLRFRQLTKICRDDPETFVREWVEFDLRGREAQENAWDLLYDYCVLSQIGYLTNMRSKMDSIIADFAGDSYTHPMGRVFGMRVIGRQTWASLLQIKPRPTITIEIDTDHIVSAAGTLDDFRLQLRHCVFRCGKYLSIAFNDSE